MRTLVIDCATEACSVALFDDSTLIEGTFNVLGRGHAERLVPMIAALPNQGRADRIAVAIGPGSFTGIRVGMAAAKALAFAWQADLVGYPTLDLVAAMARHEHGLEDLCVAMTGGHGEWFCEASGPDGAILRPLASLRPEDAAAVPEALITGSQAEALVARRGSGIALPLWPDARAFALLRPGTLTTDVQPLYGRAPDARLPGGKLPGEAA